jgi:hypothetical protein
LTDDQKENRVEISQELFANANSPDLASANVFLFPKLKATLKGLHFQTIEEIQENATRELTLSQKVLYRKHYNNGRNSGNGASPIEETIFKWTALTML